MWQRVVCVKRQAAARVTARVRARVCALGTLQKLAHPAPPQLAHTQSRRVVDTPKAHDRNTHARAAHTEREEAGAFTSNRCVARAN